MNNNDRIYLTLFGVRLAYVSNSNNFPDIIQQQNYFEM